MGAHAARIVAQAARRVNAFAGLFVNLSRVRMGRRGVCILGQSQILVPARGGRSAQGPAGWRDERTSKMSTSSRCTNNGYALKAARNAGRRSHARRSVTTKQS